MPPYVTGCKRREGVVVGGGGMGGTRSYENHSIYIKAHLLFRMHQISSTGNFACPLASRQAGGKTKVRVQ